MKNAKLLMIAVLIALMLALSGCPNPPPWLNDKTETQK